MNNPQLDDCCGRGFVGDEDGFFYCPVCGSQSQDMISTYLEVNSVYRDTFYGRTVRKTSPPEPIRQAQSQAFKVPKLEPSVNSFLNGTSVPLDFGNPTRPDLGNTRRPVFDTEEVCDNIRLPYLLGMQIMIQMQCEALVEKFGVTAMICGIVGTIWLRFLAASGVFGDDWVNVISEGKILYQNRDGNEEDKKNVCHPIKRKCESEPYNQYSRRESVILLKSLQRKIPHASSLAICFLACYMARETVLPTDIVKWALEAKLPYLAAFVDLEKRTDIPLQMCPFSSRLMFRPPRTIGSWQIESLAGGIAQTIGLRLPSVNFIPICARFINELHLPIEKILPWARYVEQWWMPPDLWLSADPSKSTRTCVMSILIVAIRILFNINGHGIWEMSLSKGREAGESSSDTKTSEYNSVDLLNHLEEIYHSLGDEHEYLKDLNTYLKYCKDVVFAGQVAPYEIDKVAEELWNFCEGDEDIGISSEAQTGCDTFNQKRHMDTEHCSRSWDNKTFASGEQIKSQQYNSNSVHADANPDRNNNATRPVMKGETSDSRGEKSDIALRRMKADMEDNGFHYIPPRRARKDGYLSYHRVLIAGVYEYAADTDYYILLRACARVVQVDVRVMFDCVQKHERTLCRVDENIDKFVREMANRSSHQHKPE